MSPEEREARIEAAAKVLVEETLHRVLPHEIPRLTAQAERILDAADKAVPVVTHAEHRREIKLWAEKVLQGAQDNYAANEAIADALERAERAEAAARALAEKLKAISNAVAASEPEVFRSRPDGVTVFFPDPVWFTIQTARDTLAAHPSYSPRSMAETAANESRNPISSSSLPSYTTDQGENG